MLSFLTKGKVYFGDSYDFSLVVIFFLTADFIFDRMPVGSLKSVLRQWQIAYNTLLQGSLFNGSRRALISQDGDNIYISFIQNNHADKEQFFLLRKAQ